MAWRPPSRELHYQALYAGVYEFLRSPPDLAYWTRAARYLKALRKCFHPQNELQGDRIRWTQAWINALDDPECSDAETVVDAE